MPTLWAHSHYWAGSSQGSPPDAPGGGGRGGYPGWQASVVGSILLALAAYWWS
jgi:hypothetical protein